MQECIPGTLHMFDYAIPRARYDESKHKIRPCKATTRFNVDRRIIRSVTCKEKVFVGGTLIERSYEYELHATKGWRRRWLQD